MLPPKAQQPPASGPGITGDAPGGALAAAVDPETAAAVAGEHPKASLLSTTAAACNELPPDSHHSPKLLFGSPAEGRPALPVTESMTGKAEAPTGRQPTAKGKDGEIVPARVAGLPSLKQAGRLDPDTSAATHELPPSIDSRAMTQAGLTPSGNTSVIEAHGVRQASDRLPELRSAPLPAQGSGLKSVLQSKKRKASAPAGNVGG